MAANDAIWKESGEVTFKLILIGNADSGKTSVLKRYISGRFDPHTENTQAVDCMNKEITLEGQPIKLNIWDTAGAERYLSVGTMYYRNADGVFLVFDVTKPKTFADIQTKWMDLVRQHEREEECVKMLIGTKCDLLEEDSEDMMKWEQYAQSQDMRLVLVSAKTGRNVESMFSEMSSQVLELRRQMGGQTDDHDPAISLTCQTSLETNEYSEQTSLRTSTVVESPSEPKSGGCGC